MIQKIYDNQSFPVGFFDCPTVCMQRIEQEKKHALAEGEKIKIGSNAADSKMKDSLSSDINIIMRFIFIG